MNAEGTVHSTLIVQFPIGRMAVKQSDKLTPVCGCVYGTTKCFGPPLKMATFFKRMRHLP